MSRNCLQIESGALEEDEKITDQQPGILDALEALVEPVTSESAVNVIRSWWDEMGQDASPEAIELLITAACGGSHSCRGRFWKIELQNLADELKMSR